MSATTTCPKCGALYEEASEEQANAPSRECTTCWMRARTDENLRVYDRPRANDETLAEFAELLLRANAARCWS